MKELMLLIRNEADSKSSFSPERNQAFLKACEIYKAKEQRKPTKSAALNKGERDALRLSGYVEKGAL